MCVFVFDLIERYIYVNLATKLTTSAQIALFCFVIDIKVLVINISKRDGRKFFVSYRITIIRKRKKIENIFNLFLIFIFF